MQRPGSSVGVPIQTPSTAKESETFGNETAGKFHVEMRLFFALGVTVMGILFVVAITLIVIAKGAPAVTTVVVKDDAVTLEPKQVANELGSILPPQRKGEASKAPPTEKERTMSPLRKDDEVTATTRPAVTTPRAPPLPRNVLVCTVNGEGPWLEHISPPVGVCGIIFFDSLYREDEHLPDANYHANSDAFLNWPKKHPNGEFGVSLSTWNSKISFEILGNVFGDTIRSFYHKGIRHVACININRESVKKEEFTVALEALKIAYDTFMAFTSNKPNYFVVGVVFTAAAQYELVKSMREIFIPSLFIAITHISFDETYLDFCRIFPPTWVAAPENIGPDNPIYVNNMLLACGILSEVPKTGIEVPVAISFTLSAHLYEPIISNPTAPELEEFEVFKPCKGRHAYENEYFVTPSERCYPNRTKHTTVAKTEHGDTVYGFHTAEKVSFTWDNKDTMKVKVCETKKHCGETTTFGVAAFDIEYDILDEPCPAFGLNGTFGRVAFLRNVNEHLTSLAWNEALNKLKCVHVEAS